MGDFISQSVMVVTQAIHVTINPLPCFIQYYVAEVVGGSEVIVGFYGTSFCSCSLVDCLQLALMMGLSVSGGSVSEAGWLQSWRYQRTRSTSEFCNHTIMLLY